MQISSGDKTKQTDCNKGTNKQTQLIWVAQMKWQHDGKRWNSNKMHSLTEKGNELKFPGGEG